MQPPPRRESSIVSRVDRGDSTDGTLSSQGSLNGAKPWSGFIANQRNQAVVLAQAVPTPVERPTVSPSQTKPDGDAVWLSVIYRCGLGDTRLLTRCGLVAVARSRNRTKSPSRPRTEPLKSVLNPLFQLMNCSGRFSRPVSKSVWVRFLYELLFHYSVCRRSRFPECHLRRTRG